VSGPTLVIRFSALGEVVLSGAVTGGLGPVHFLTSPQLAEIAAILPGVEAVHRWGVDRLPDAPWARVVDLHGSPRSRLVCAALPGHVSRIRRYTAVRRLRVAFKTRPAPPLLTRYASAAQVAPATAPWIARPGPGPRDALLLCPGAAHATKRWPGERFGDLAAAWEGPVLVLGGPGEEALCAAVAARAREGAAIAGRGFAAVLDHLHRGRACVAGDTGLMHLCAAAGIPTVALFGPTTAADGFWAHGAGHAPGSCPVEQELPCRPCSRFGGPVCPMGDHLCLQGLSVDAVQGALRSALAEAGP
jgi:ADP-heptose:LPS heptosyltransferase